MIPDWTLRVIQAVGGTALTVTMVYLFFNPVIPPGEEPKPGMLESMSERLLEDDNKDNFIPPVRAMSGEDPGNVLWRIAERHDSASVLYAHPRCNPDSEEFLTRSLPEEEHAQMFEACSLLLSGSYKVEMPE